MAGRGSGNARNGYYPKTVRTEVGDVRLDVPRDRNGTFEPATVPVGQRHPAGLDQAIISLYAKGLMLGLLILAAPSGVVLDRGLVQLVLPMVLLLWCQFGFLSRRLTGRPLWGVAAVIGYFTVVTLAVIA